MNEVGRVMALSVGQRRGEGKARVDFAYLQSGYGLVGDAHAGPGAMQVSLVAMEDVEEVNRTYGLEAGPGDFAANIAVAGLNLAALPLGSQLRLGQAKVEVAQIGKDRNLAHDFSFRGISLLVDKGVFCRVLSSGWVRVGDRAEVLSPSEY